ncbi:replication protein [Streptococcus loxodontisalivarius]|uniref:Replication protein RepB n=1 Tax=Streptococcus loxodontisalivarius TaxID=1349415 RepID=A0ABS2PUN9_9STRE|nr:replication protein [Streptococcus loxodontisalivarius]MBM7643730.1 hypothetical protein [Streptococcus loxodontisalivarius]
MTTRSNKWAFLIYKDSAPENYLEVLESLQVPFILSPWHDKDINFKTGELKKPHKHGALFFDSLKSYKQVSELVNEKLNSPKHIEPVMSPTGMYHYFTHQENKEKASYDPRDIESGAGFDLDSFLYTQNANNYLTEMIDTIEKENIQEFGDLILYARANNQAFLELITDKAYFFSRYMDSRRYSHKRIDLLNQLSTDTLDEQTDKQPKELETKDHA